MRSSKSERWTDNTMTNEEQKIGEIDRQYSGKYVKCYGPFPTIISFVTQNNLIASRNRETIIYSSGIFPVVIQAKDKPAIFSGKG
jgi:hypothetical protein